MLLTPAAAVFLTSTAVAAVVIAWLVITQARRSASASRNAAMLRAVPDVMFVQSRDGVYLDFHAADTSMLLLPPGRFLGRNMRDVLPRAVLDVVEPLFDRLSKSDGPVLGEYTMEIGGETRFYEVRLFRYEGDKVLSLVRDVTERTKMAAALRASEERYALATMAGRAGVWDWNLKTDTIYVDPRLKAILGFDDHEIGGRIDEWAQHVHPEDRSMTFAQVRAHVSGDTSSFESEHRMVHKDGSIRWFLARATLVRDESGTPTRLVGTDTDITEQKQADEALHRLQMDLDRVSRLATLGEYGAAIAHEVRQPLAAIVINAGTCLRLLAHDPPDLGQVRAMVGDMADAGKRADAMLRRARELFGQHTVEKHPLDVNNVIREVVVLAEARLRSARVRIDLHLVKHVPPVLGDRIALSQVLLNLVANSIDAMATVEPAHRLLTITSSVTHDLAVQISVRDQGVGLDDVDTARMFMPAYTTKPNGTGVGLSISRTIVEAHGGTLWAVPNDGVGSTFSFAIPAMSASAVPV
jgi:PAS domain S-box-containing protein